jgi:hypothetical protein
MDTEKYNRFLVPDTKQLKPKKGKIVSNIDVYR